MLIRLIPCSIFLLFTTSSVLGQVFTVDENGVTILCEGASVGDTGLIDGILYTKRSADQITSSNAATTCTSGITEMTKMFSGEKTFDEDISHWDVSSVTNMEGMFEKTREFNQDLGFWDVSSVVDMDKMFNNARAFNQDLSEWCVANITSEPNKFAAGANSWTLDHPVWGTCPNADFSVLSNGITVQCTDASLGDFGTLNGITYTKRSAAQIDTSNAATTCTSDINDMEEQFRDASSFDGDIRHWDVSSVTAMTSMFENATSFNQDLGDWDVSSVTAMTSMFENATSFNQDLSDWDVSYFSSEPADFALGATSWILSKPLWRINDTIPPIIPSGQSFVYQPGRPAGASLGVVRALDNVGVVRFSLDYETGEQGFAYNSNGWYQVSNTGAISLTSTGSNGTASNSSDIPPNDFTLPVRAFDASGNSTTENIRLTIDGNSPVLPAGQYLQYAENRNSEQPIATVNVSDDRGVTSLYIDAVMGPNGEDYTLENYFAVATSGAISLTKRGLESGFVNDFEVIPNTFMLTLTASDEAGNTTTQNVTLIVTNLDEELAVIGPDVEMTYAEGQEVGVSLAQITATDNIGITDFDIISVQGVDSVDYTTNEWYAISTVGHISLTEAGFNEAPNTYEIEPNTFILGVVAIDAALNQTIDTATVILHVWQRIHTGVTLIPVTQSYVSATPTLSWSPHPLATHYYIEVFSISKDTTMVMHNTVITSTTTLPALEYQRDYMWRVRPSNGYSDGPWSEMSSFTTEFVPVGRAQLIAPAQNAVDVIIPTIFSWEVLENVETYEFQLFTDAMLTEVVSLHTTATTLTLDSLQASTDYLYRVRAKNQTSISPWVNHEFTTKTSTVVTSTAGDDGAPVAFALEQNYPNPFNSTATIQYSLPKPSFVRLTVYNMMGQRVATLVESPKPVGYHSVMFDATGLGCGTYVYRLEAGSFYLSKTLCLVK